MINYYTDCH